MSGMQSEQILYREFSRVAIPGDRVEIVADTSVMLIDGQIVHRIHSGFLDDDCYLDVVITGADPVADNRTLLAARREVMRINVGSMNENPERLRRQDDVQGV